MIIQCEQCRTKFRLDESRVKDTGVKVRCAKCKHIFTVRKELPETPPQPDFAALLDQSAGPAEQAPPAAPFAAASESAAAETAQDLAEIPFAGIDQAEKAADRDSNLFEPSMEGLHPSVMPADDSVSSTAGEWEQTLKSDTAPIPDSENVFAGFDFANAPADADKTALPSTAFSDSADEFSFQAPDVPADITAQLPDFPDFTTTPGVTEEKTAAPNAVEADRFSFDVVDSAPQPAAAPPEEPAPAQAAPVQTSSVAPREEPQPEALPAASAPEPAAVIEEEELPPLSIASRRKQSPLVKVLITVLILAAAAALYFNYGSSLLQKVMHTAAPEQGSITLRSIDAFFVKNASVGEMLVISGEAVNGYNVPRTAIQVKGVVYGDSNQILASKNAFSGNILPREQLATMPLEKIEAAMANQFGGALDNLEVAPGKAVPFMIVISKLPEGAKNFGALPAGSSAVTKPK